MLLKIMLVALTPLQIAPNMHNATLLLVIPFCIIIDPIITPNTHNTLRIIYSSYTDFTYLIVIPSFITDLSSASNRSSCDSAPLFI